MDIAIYSLIKQILQSKHDEALGMALHLQHQLQLPEEHRVIDVDTVEIRNNLLIANSNATQYQEALTQFTYLFAESRKHNESTSIPAGYGSEAREEDGRVRGY